MTRWPISDAQRSEIVEAMAEIATDSRAKPRDRVSAAKVLIEADRVNVAADRDGPPKPKAIAEPKPDSNRFLVVAQQLNLTLGSAVPVTDPETAAPKLASDLPNDG